MKGVRRSLRPDTDARRRRSCGCCASSSPHRGPEAGAALFPQLRPSVRAGIGLNCCAMRTSSSIWPMVVHPTARQCTGKLSAYVRQSLSGKAAAIRAVGRALHRLNSHAAFDGNRQNHFLEAQIRRVGCIHRHQNGVVLVVILEHGQMDFRVMGPVKPMKRHLPAFLAASKASIAPPGAKICRTSSILANVVNLPEIDDSPCAESGGTSRGPASASFRLRPIDLLVRNMFLRYGFRTSP